MTTVSYKKHNDRIVQINLTIPDIFYDNLSVIAHTKERLFTPYTNDYLCYKGKNDLTICMSEKYDDSDYNVNKFKHTSFRFYISRNFLKNEGSYLNVSTCKNFADLAKYWRYVQEVIDEVINAKIIETS